MRFWYSGFWILALPFVGLFLVVRALRHSRYRPHWQDRFMIGSQKPSSFRAPIWIHAVSVGETRAAQPLITGLLKKNPNLNILLTHMTPTGRETGKELFASHIQQGRLMQAYLPYDAGFLMRRFFKFWQPQVGLILETEVWPNLMAVATQESVKVALVNARLSEKSLVKGKKFFPLIREAVRSFSLIIAQSDADAKRIKEFDPITPVLVVGSTKFDVAVNQSQVAVGMYWREAWQRPTLVFASSRDGEEQMFLDAHKSWQTKHPQLMKDLLCIIVPRHPERFGQIEALVKAQGLRLQRRSDLQSAAGHANELFAETQILLGDSMGEMFAYYAASEVAMIGGSFAPFGSQNLLEAMAVGVPPIIGPSRFNFDHIAAQAISSGGAFGVSDMTEAFSAATELLTSSKKKIASLKAREFCAEHQGATQRILEILNSSQLLNH